MSHVLKLLEGEAWHLAELKTQLADEQISSFYMFMGDHSIPDVDSEDEVIYSGPPHI